MKWDKFALAEGHVNKYGGFKYEMWLDGYDLPSIFSLYALQQRTHNICTNAINREMRIFLEVYGIILGQCGNKV